MTTTALAVLAAVSTPSLVAQARPRPKQNEFVAQVRDLIDHNLLGSIDSEQWATLGLDAVNKNRHKDAVGFLKKVYKEVRSSSKVSAKAKSLMAAIIGVQYAGRGSFGITDGTPLHRHGRSGGKRSATSTYWLGLAKNHLDEDTTIAPELYDQVYMHYMESLAEAYKPAWNFNSSTRPLKVLQENYRHWEKRTPTFVFDKPDAWAKSMKRWIRISDRMIRKVRMAIPKSGFKTLLRAEADEMETAKRKLEEE